MQIKNFLPVVLAAVATASPVANPNYKTSTPEAKYPTTTQKAHYPTSTPEHHYPTTTEKKVQYPASTPVAQYPTTTEKKMEYPTSKPKPQYPTSTMETHYITTTEKKAQYPTSTPETHHSTTTQKHKEHKEKPTKTKSSHKHEKTKHSKEHAKEKHHSKESKRGEYPTKYPASTPTYPGYPAASSQPQGGNDGWGSEGGLGGLARICPLGNTPLCCQVDIDGILDLTCGSPARDLNSIEEFVGSCADNGLTAECCVLPLIGDALLCTAV
ncbi:fungal hydrophobin-domain-containing protein [Daldinia decipiens]|uniref:fungal hydrophobin-domain-containing protein n=1 Tax=Daldinia decipiens TaxID=326647 RepID=UPI0020C55B4A|nr:fungal hydrophobin-domain-containing protein [Daldinia decipiens]KAI1659978.1 fungal hydrophobin-domain-containing protein [Daldinia decipiens]